MAEGVEEETAVLPRGCHHANRELEERAGAVGRRRALDRYHIVRGAGGCLCPFHRPLNLRAITMIAGRLKLITADVSVRVAEDDIAR